MITAKIDPIGKDLAIILNETLSRDARAKIVADIAREELASAQAINQQALGTIPPHETYVDRVLNAPLESVNPDRGLIVFEFELVQEVFAWIGEQLVQHSPVLTGRYSQSHVFTADGVEIEPGAPVPPAQEYIFVNVQPYARKIEPPRAQSDQAPAGVYQAVALLARRRFGNVAKIRFTYATPLGGAINEWANATSLKRKGRNMTADQRAEWLRRQPAIKITVG